MVENYLIDYGDVLSTSACGSLTTFLPENQDNLNKRLRLIIQKNHDGDRFDDDSIAKIDEAIENSSITSTQFKNISIKFRLI